MFSALSQKDQLLEVGVDDVKMMVPSQRQAAIGTRHLNGCTCVVILGVTAIVMAHISPLPGNAADWTQRSTSDRQKASFDHHQRFLQAIEELVKQNRQRFPASDTAWGIFSVDADRRPLSTVVDQVEKHLSAIGFTMNKSFYKEMKAEDVRPPKGEIVALFRLGKHELYLERTLIWSKQLQGPPSTASGSSSSTSQKQASASTSATASAQIPNAYWQWKGDTRQIVYVAQGHVQPQDKWPDTSGQAPVWFPDDKSWRFWNFDKKSWI